MVRAGVVDHPAEWAFGGYHEIQGNRRRNRLLALDVLAEVAEADNPESLARGHREWIGEALRAEGSQRNEAWTKSLAIGSEQFVLKVQESLGIRGQGRGVFATGDAYVLRESPEAYKASFDPENRAIAQNVGSFGGVFS
jgi:putative transposase